MPVEPGEYGLVKITHGQDEGCIVYYDNDDFDDNKSMAVVYFGGFLLAQKNYLIEYTYIDTVSMYDLVKRRDELYSLCTPFNIHKKTLDAKTLNFHLAELHLVETNLLENIMDQRYEKDPGGIKVFISHSSIDKPFAKMLCLDLEANGYMPWLDEWDISVGESIPERVSAGLQEADFVIVILSVNSVSSKWVEREWQIKYWNEIENGKIKVLPVLLEDCLIPELLKTKRYADFRFDFNKGLHDLINALEKLSTR